MKRPVISMLLVWAGCSSSERVLQVPADFALEYRWESGSVPPPYYCAYTVSSNAAGEGRMELVPGYAGDDPPAWTEDFRVTAETVLDLYRAVERQRIATHAWNAEPESPDGGSSETLRLTAGGRQVTIPEHLARGDRERIEPLYGSLRALIPSEVWGRQEARRTEYRETKR